jgi:hypothetical protein
MTRSMLPIIVAAVASLIACGDTEQVSNPSEPPLVTFEGGAIIDGALDPALVTAWEEARTNPDGGLPYSFSVRTTGLREGTRIDLVMARYRGLYVNGIPVTDGGYTVQTTTTRSDSSATFDPPGVATGEWSWTDHAVPAALLCGESVVMAQAIDASETTVVASTYLLVVNAPCP